MTIATPTTRRFRVTYRDLDPASPELSCIVTAFDRQDARERFWEAIGDDGWVIVRIRRIHT